MSNNLKVRKNLLGTDNFNNKKIKNPPHKMAKSKFNHVNCIFLEPLNLVACIIIVRMCIINMPIGEITSYFFTKGTFYLHYKMAIL